MKLQHLNHYSLYFTILCASLWVCLTIILLLDKDTPPDRSTTLKLVHVIFRHGDKNPEPDGLSPTDPYSDEKYYEEGYSQLTKEGQNTAYNLGILLRKRYNHFLTDYWYIKYLDPRTTETDRTKMTLELVLAALYPPRGETIGPVPCWQPIPYSVTPFFEDQILLPHLKCWPRLRKLIDNLLETPELSRYKARNDELKAILSSKMHFDPGWFEILISSVYYAACRQEQMGLPLEPWIKAIYPEPLEAVTVDTYYLFTNTTVLKRIMAGYTLKKILDDTRMKINGTLQPAERKMFLYSAHDFNIASMLLSLKATDINIMPPCGSYVIFEVHEIDGVYGMKLFYSFDHGNDSIAIKLPDCDYFCPFEEFYSLVDDILPQPDEDCIM